MQTTVQATLVLIIAASVYGQPAQVQTEIAFSASLSHHTVLGDGQKVVYDRIFTNVGSGYDGATGVFTCPQSGLYVFQVHSLARSTADMYIELYHNYDYVVSLWAYSDTDYANAGNSVVLHLNKGDTVYIQNVSGYASELYGDSSEVYATFSGYLISPAFQDSGIIG